MNKVLILGGYGNFGCRIACALAKDNIAIIIAGRDQHKADTLAKNLQKKYPHSTIETAIFDAKLYLPIHLKKLNPRIVINTAGPFQNSDYSIAKACIAQHIHYIDLADGRDFVREISSLNLAAQAANTLVISGASTVPALSSAVLEKYKHAFSTIDSLVFGISPGQKAHRGLATTAGILSYIGKQLKNSKDGKVRYGWQDMYRIKYPELGWRWMANCDVPDLDIFPDRYNIGTIQFSAGMESRLLHFTIWSLSWLVRLGVPLNLPKHAQVLLNMSHWFDWLGSADGGMHIVISGKDHNNKPKQIKWFVIAKQGDGPHIPTIPALVLTKKILANEIQQTGALPCVAMITLEEYMHELRDFDVQQYSFVG